MLIIPNLSNQEELEVVTHPITLNGTSRATSQKLFIFPTIEMVGFIQRTLEGLMNRFQLRYLGLNHGSIHPVAFPQKHLELGKLPLEFLADYHSF